MIINKNYFYFKDNKLCTMRLNPLQRLARKLGFYAETHLKTVSREVHKMALQSPHKMEITDEVAQMLSKAARSGYSTLLRRTWVGKQTIDYRLKTLCETTQHPLNPQERLAYIVEAHIKPAGKKKSLIQLLAWFNTETQKFVYTATVLNKNMGVALSKIELSHLFFNVLHSQRERVDVALQLPGNDTEYTVTVERINPRLSTNGLGFGWNRHFQKLA